MSTTYSPNWDEWLNLQSVQVWEAVALSLDCEPEALPGLDLGWRAAPFDGCSPEFLSRLRTATSALGSGLNSSANVTFRPERSLVRLDDFATWAAQLRRPWALPKALSSLVSVTSSASQAGGSAELSDAVGSRAVSARGKAHSTALDKSSSLSTDEVGEAFADIGMSSIDWRKALTKNRQAWLKECIASVGKTGAHPVQGRWFPLKIAEALVLGRSRKAGCVSPDDLDRAFKQRPLLRPFRDAWLNLRSDNPAWGD